MLPRAALAARSSFISFHVHPGVKQPEEVFRGCGAISCASALEVSREFPRFGPPRPAHCAFRVRRRSQPGSVGLHQNAVQRQPGCNLPAAAGPWVGQVPANEIRNPCRASGLPVRSCRRSSASRRPGRSAASGPPESPADPPRRQSLRPWVGSGSGWPPARRGDFQLANQSRALNRVIAPSW